LKTDVHFRPDLESLDLTVEAETEGEIALLVWLRLTAPEWSEATPPDTSVRLTFKGSKASAAILQYIRSAGLSEIGTHNPVEHEGN
jgi:hypothetical protein